MNVGEHHNAMIEYIFADLDQYTNEEISEKLATSSYTVSKMKEYCEIKSIELPSDTELNENFEKNKNVSLQEIITNPIFSKEQQIILSESFDSLEIVDGSLDNGDKLSEILNKNLDKLNSLKDDQGKTIAIATINQLKASNELWIKNGRVNFLEDKGYSSKRPSNGAILAADGKGLVGALVFGGGMWTPIGWAGSMFVGAGASIGSYMGSPLWWPF